MSKKPKKPFNKKPSNKSIRYADMGVQLLVAIGIGVFIGMQIDKYYSNETPYATAAGALLGICLGLYNVLKDLL